MAVAKGQIQSDNSYRYTCGNCQGMGFLLDSRRGSELCSHCYNGDYAAITEAMKSARGQRYYALLKAALSVAGKSIADKMQALKAEHGKVNLPMTGYLCYHFNMNFKALGEWLEECRLTPTGTTQRISETTFTMPDGSKQRFKVKFMLEQGEKWYQETYNKEWDRFSPE